MLKTSKRGADFDCTLFAPTDGTKVFSYAPFSHPKQNMAFKPAVFKKRQVEWLLGEYCEQP
jgi:hypothetical protein